MTAQTPELLNQIAQWRQKSTDGTITLDEMREAVKVLRAGRVSAITEAGKVKRAAAGKSTKGPARSAGDLLDDLEKI